MSSLMEKYINENPRFFIRIINKILKKLTYKETTVPVKKIIGKGKTTDSTVTSKFYWKLERKMESKMN